MSQEQYPCELCNTMVPVAVLLLENALAAVHDAEGYRIELDLCKSCLAEAKKKK